MKRKNYRLAEIVLIISAALLGLLIKGYATNWVDIWVDVLSGYSLWIIFPYLAFFVISFVANKRAYSKSVHISSFIVSIIILLFTTMTYAEAFYFHPTIASPLAFFIIPMCIFIGGPILFFVIDRLLKRIIQKNKNT